MIKVDYFTVVCSLTGPWHEIEACVDLVLIETSLLSYVNDAVLVLISRNFHKKSSEVSIKTVSFKA